MTKWRFEAWKATWGHLVTPLLKCTYLFAISKKLQNLAFIISFVIHIRDAAIERNRKCNIDGTKDLIIKMDN